MKRYDTIEIKFPARGAKPALPIHLGRTDLAAIMEAIDTTIQHEMEFRSVRLHEWNWPEDIEKDNLLAQRKQMDRMSDHGKHNMRNIGHHPFLFTENEVKLLYSTMGVFHDYIMGDIDEYLTTEHRNERLDADDLPYGESETKIETITRVKSYFDALWSVSRSALHLPRLTHERPD